MLAVTTTPISALCPKCGFISQSGKSTCCGRGGSWFGNCGGSAGNVRLGHTWSEGVQACKARDFRLVVDQHQHASDPKSNTTSDEDKAVIVTPNIFTSASANTLTPMLGMAPTTAPTNTSIPTSTYNASTSSSKANVMTKATITHSSVDISTLKVIIPPVNESIIKPTQNDWADMSVTMSSHAPVGECGKALIALTQIYVVLIIGFIEG